MYFSLKEPRLRNDYPQNQQITHKIIRCEVPVGGGACVRVLYIGYGIGDRSQLRPSTRSIRASRPRHPLGSQQERLRLLAAQGRRLALGVLSRGTRRVAAGSQALKLASALAARLAIAATGWEGR